jgi:leader peptidase (prepilin peptidase)/N-methyltransferase
MLATGLVFALFGAIIGSFVGAAVLRMPAERGIVAGRSSCDGCGTILRPVELVPILSFAWQRGRCRHCHARIAIEQWIAEIACSLVGLLAACTTGEITGAMSLALFGWTLVALALLDVRHHWLPDRLTLPLVAAGLASAFVLPEPGPFDRIAGAIFGYALLEGLRYLYRHIRHREGLGGGDPKLLAAIGAWLGTEALPWVILVAGILGLALVALQRIRGHRLSGSDRLPLGTLLAIAAITMMPIVMNGQDILISST